MVKIMKRAKNWAIVAAATLSFAGCGEEQVEQEAVADPSEVETAAVSVSPKDVQDEWVGGAAR